MNKGLFVIVVLFLFLPWAAVADETVTCESEDDRRRLCPVRGLDDRRVFLERQFSKSDCDEGRTWGTTRFGIWVQGGCRATFHVQDARRFDDRRCGAPPRDFPPRDYYDRDPRNEPRGWEPREERDEHYELITCESNDARREFCDVRNLRNRDVRIFRQLSKASCRQGETWGIGRHGIWVERGCRAQFKISSGY